MERITRTELETLQRNNFFKSENGYTESGTYKVSFDGLVVFEYYFNDGSIIEREDIIGRYVG